MIYVLIGMMVPGEATIVPLFITVKDLKLIDSYAGEDPAKHCGLYESDHHDNVL